MALIRIHADGTFETAHVEEATAAAKTPAQHKADLRDIKADLTILRTIGNLRGRLDILRTTVKNAKTPAAKASAKSRIDAVKIKMTDQRSKRKFPRLSVIGLHKKVKVALAAIGKLPTAPGTATSTPRAPKDHAAAFNSGAKKIAGTVTRGIRSELRDHGKTALVPVANRPGAKAPVAKPSGKTANTATTHATKPARGAIGNTLTEIKKIKASIATGELKGAKLIRAREELEKQREALRGLRAGKSPANQRAIVKPGTAKHMGGAKKIVGKPSGMGEPMKKLHDTMGGIHEKRLQKALVAAKGDAVLSRKIRKMIKENREEPAMHSKKDLSDVGAK